MTKLTNDGVNKIIALGHAGYAMDQQVARLSGVDVVIGGHTNTFLYTGEALSGYSVLYMCALCNSLRNHEIIHLVSPKLRVPVVTTFE